jgi:hypothetical protein
MDFPIKTDAELFLDQCERQFNGQVYTLELVDGQWRLELQTASAGATELPGHRLPWPTTVEAA